MSRPYGDESYICPSCGGGTNVVSIRATSITHEGNGFTRELRMDIVKCADCGVVFAVDESTIPSAEEAEELYK
jgi:2-phospho-L-lactate guanylyltransferase (CobY/MobA/RfbA family)